MMFSNLNALSLYDHRKLCLILPYYATWNHQDSLRKKKKRAHAFVFQLKTGVNLLNAIPPMPAIMPVIVVVCGGLWLGIWCRMIFTQIG